MWVNHGKMERMGKEESCQEEDTYLAVSATAVIWQTELYCEWQ